jgi:hypothetical protein
MGPKGEPITQKRWKDTGPDGSVGVRWVPKKGGEPGQEYAYNYFTSGKKMGQIEPLMYEGEQMSRPMTGAGAAGQKQGSQFWLEGGTGGAEGIKEGFKQMFTRRAGQVSPVYREPQPGGVRGAPVIERIEGPRELTEAQKLKAAERRTSRLAIREMSQDAKDNLVDRVKDNGLRGLHRQEIEALMPLPGEEVDHDLIALWRELGILGEMQKLVSSPEWSTGAQRLLEGMRAQGRGGPQSMGPGR